MNPISDRGLGSLSDADHLLKNYLRVTKKKHSPESEIVIGLNKIQSKKKISTHQVWVVQECGAKLVCNKERSQDLMRKSHVI